ncbi:MAG TPA: pirin [Acidobacteria bacterium]|nr:pirin [Acidobacteriota bacterium]
MGRKLREIFGELISPDTAVLPAPLKLPPSGTPRLFRSDAPDGDQKLGFVSRLIVTTTLPHSKPCDAEFTRHSGLYDLCLLAPRRIGLPYGRYPRLALAWMITEAVRTKAPLLRPAPSLSRFASQIGITPSTGAKGTLTQLRDQLLRLVNLTVLCLDAPAHPSPQALPSAFRGGGVHLVTCYRLWWDQPAPDDPEPFILLSRDFVDEVLAHPIPIDLNVIRNLRSSLEMDVYMWLTYRSVRSCRLGRPETIPWPALQRQFGADYADLRVFRFHFLRAVKKILDVYPEIRLRNTPGGLVVLPFPPHILPAPR